MAQPDQQPSSILVFDSCAKHVYDSNALQLLNGVNSEDSVFIKEQSCTIITKHSCVKLHQKALVHN